jgi:anti-sigma factor RsiW
MTAPLGCDKVLLVQAELDGELDAAEAAALAAHRADCPYCQAAATQLGRAAGLIDRELYRPMPDEVRARVMRRLPEAASPPSTFSLLAWWRWGAGFGLGAACAAALLLLVLLPQGGGLADEIVASHIRALQPGHLEDVPSTDQHTVKPWFDGRIDFAPPVKNLAAQRFPLRGGRLDYVGGRPVAALVYQRDKHLIDLYVWPAEGGVSAPESAVRNGYNIVHWRDGGMALWAVSDLEMSQLREFAEDWLRSP